MRRRTNKIGQLIFPTSVGFFAGYSLFSFKQSELKPVRWDQGQQLSDKCFLDFKIESFALNNRGMKIRADQGAKGLNQYRVLFQQAYSLNPEHQIIRSNYGLSLLATVDQFLLKENPSVEKAAAIFKEIDDVLHQTDDLTTGNCIAIGYRHQRFANVLERVEDKRHVLQQAITFYDKGWALEQNNKVAACLVGEACLDQVKLLSDESSQKEMLITKAASAFTQAIKISEGYYPLATYRRGLVGLYSVHREKVVQGESDLRDAVSTYQETPDAFPHEFASGIDTLLQLIPHYEGEESLREELMTITRPPSSGC